MLIARQHSQTTDLTGFYRNLLDNNEAFGTGPSKPDAKAATSSAAAKAPGPVAEGKQPDRQRAKRDIDRSTVRLEPEYRPAVQYFEPAAKQAKNVDELTEEEVRRQARVIWCCECGLLLICDCVQQAKYSRKTSSDAAAAAKARALARRKQKKRPQRMED